MNCLIWLVFLSVTATAKEYTVQVKKKVYANIPASIQDLKAGIHEAIDDIVQPLCDSVMENFRKRLLSYEEISSFPKLFYLDDYKRCLSRKDGLYCLGIFDLLPDDQPNPGYDLLKKYSDDHLRHFNRTRIHRGYCVSTRCPNYVTGNASERLERCVNKFARRRSLRASIHTLQYCHTYSDEHTVKPRTQQQDTFLQCFYALIVVNIMGTLYDMCTSDSPDKNKLITAFSIPSNWRRLTIIYEGGDPRLTALTPINGLRVIAMLSTIFAHSNVIHYSFYITNPEELEKQTERVDGIFLSDGTSVIQSLVMLSCFLTCYNLLIFSEKRPLNLSMLPLCLIKRFIRITPVNLFMVGFGATWWLHMRDGPIVATTIGQETRACETKFWSQIFHLNNWINPSDYCFLPSWFLPMDMHLYIISCILTLTMWRRRCNAVKLYMILLLASCTFNGVVAYIMDYKSMIYLSTPEQIRSLFRNIKSFLNFYMSSWGALPSCFIGLILANIQYELHEKRINLSEYKWFVYLHYITVPLVFVWGLKGALARKFNSPVFYAVNIALDSPFYCICMCVFILGLIHVDGAVKRLFGWSGWTAMARMSLTVLILHWCVNMTIAARPFAYSTSVFDVVIDWTATCVITYILAVPITLLVETPVQRFLGYLIF